VVETGIVPTINTGIAHQEPGIGQVGAGVARAPVACFEQAAAWRWRARLEVRMMLDPTLTNRVRRGSYLDSVALMRLSRGNFGDGGHRGGSLHDGLAAQPGGSRERRNVER
jgi:hypothetical protein